MYTALHYYIWIDITSYYKLGQPGTMAMKQSTGVILSQRERETETHTHIVQTEVIESVNCQKGHT